MFCLAAGGSPWVGANFIGLFGAHVLFLAGPLLEFVSAYEDSAARKFDGDFGAALGVLLSFA